MPEPLASCRALSKTYGTASGGIEALHHVDAVFPGAAITVVVGPSGSGKSTLLRALAGLDRPSGGSVRVAGHELVDATPAELRRHRRNTVTYVNQRPADNFVPHLTLAEHTRRETALAGRLLAEFGLEHRLASTPAQLSGGEQARAAFALALARDTPLIVADEPTAELDRDSAGRLLGAVKDHVGRGTAFVVATHDPDVIAVADRVVYLDRGRVTTPGVQSQAPPSAPRPMTGDSDVVATADRVGKQFTGHGEVIHAIRDASVELRRGQLAALLGRSGSGKSTLLMLLAGWQTPDTGHVRHRAGSNPATLAWHELALLPQRFGLLPELSVRENVEYPARLAGQLRRHRRHTSRLLAELGLDELADRLPHETSIGQQQRAALARALALHPTVLLADEPTSHQDAGWRDNVWNLLEQAAAEGTSCLVATHDHDIEHHAAHVWHLSEGTVTPQDVSA